MPTGRTMDRRQLSNGRNLVFSLEGYTTVVSCSAPQLSHLKDRKTTSVFESQPSSGKIIGPGDKL